MKTSYFIEILKSKLLAEVSPLQISIKNTEILSSKILDKTNHYLSPTTLQRVFELVPYSSTISESSLDVLADFIGFQNWKSFCKEQEEPHCEKKTDIILDEMGLKLFEMCLKNHDFKTVIEYLKLMPSDYYENMYATRVGHIFGNVFRKDKKAREVLLPELAKFENGRLYFYENFVDIDFLQIYYADSLNHYKKHVKPKDKLKTKRDLIFANSLEFLNCMKNNQKKKSIQKGYQMMNDFAPETINRHDIESSFPMIRFHAYHLIYLFLSNNLTQSKVDSTLIFLEEQMEELDDQATTFVLAELYRALYLIGNYANIIYLYEKYATLNKISNGISSTYLPLMNFVKMSYSHLQMEDKAKLLEIKQPEMILKDYCCF